MDDRPPQIVIPRATRVALPASALVSGLLLAGSTLSGCHSTPVIGPHVPTRTGNHFYCRQIDDCVAGITARKIARKHLVHNVPADCPAPSCDYRRGYEQAYVDVALGSGGVPPAVPPAMYWQSGLRTPAGHARAEDWYRGYSDGARTAMPLRGEFNHVRGLPPGVGAPGP